VLSLRDHFLETLTPEHEDTSGKSVAESSTENPNAWAIRYINTAQLQRMMEAIDDDASGFISIAEMNRFTNSRPRGWRLVSLDNQIDTV
jgi:Ca2+-binding EF-hand superfamily protein